MTNKILVLRNGIEAMASHFLGMQPYPVDAFNTNRFIDMNPWEENVDLKKLHHWVADQMNILWSSSGEVPCFPERYGNGKQKVRINKNVAHFTGEGWSFTFYRDGVKAHTERMKELIKTRDVSSLPTTTEIVL